MKNLLSKVMTVFLMKTSTGRELAYCHELRSYLRGTGWFKSREENSPVDGNGERLPWFTYPAIRFVSEKIAPSMVVFEYGSGNSTTWWSKRVSRVISCEHDRDWFCTVRGQALPNVECIHRELDYGGEYSKVVATFDSRFDIVVIDGRDRVNCAINCVGALKRDGVILWDDSDRKQYLKGYDFLSANGFRRLDFKGLGPGLTFEWCTSIFYRTCNCLGI